MQMHGTHTFVCLCMPLYAFVCICMHLYALVWLRRNIGRLAKSVKSRKHPAKNIVNQYMRAVAASVLRSRDDSLDDTLSSGDDEEELEASPHPLVPLGPVTSKTQVGDVVWPSSMRFSHRRMHAHCGDQNARPRVLLPTLGAEICDRNSRRNNGFEFITLIKNVRAGMWSYSCSEREVRWPDRLTQSSWFSVHYRDLPHSLAPSNEAQAARLEPDSLLYGRFHHFARVTMDAWLSNDRLHYLGACTLYEAQVWMEEAAGLHCINLRRPIQVKHAHCAEPTDKYYINMRDIITQVATAPAVHLNDDSKFVVDPHKLVMLPMQK
jgi:hypothetical protein